MFEVFVLFCNCKASDVHFHFLGELWALKCLYLLNKPRVSKKGKNVIGMTF